LKQAENNINYTPSL